ncbi:MAG: MBL fold metallo-hydrolase [Clostridia bacterium]|nr:MBL fold metallo-hydrolase [Clostridia bacterium]
MSLQSDYQDFLQRHEKQMSGPLAKYWKNQEARYVHPFRIFGNVWYVGDDWVCVHLIDTGDGLLLIDCGNTGATAMLVNAIWEAGFNPADVKWLVLSHGHLDHIGGAAFFRNMFGTKIYLGAPDAKMYREHPELSFIQDAGNVSEALVMPDVEINDGDVIRFGNTDVRFYLSPGHTMGVISCFFDAHDGEKTVRCGYYGGFGFNTLQKDYLIEIGDPEYKTRQIYLDSLARAREQKVDLFLGNHCINNDTLGRRKKQLENPDGPNPFLDDTLWARYLDQKRDDLLRFMADPKNN